MTAEDALTLYKSVLQYRTEHPERFADTRPIDFNEGLFLFKELHPTKRKESMILTGVLIDYLLEKEVATMEDIKRDLAVSHPAVLRRMHVLRRQNLVKRQSKKFYLATPRLLEFRTKFFGRLLKGATE